MGCAAATAGYGACERPGELEPGFLVFRHGLSAAGLGRGVPTVPSFVVHLY